MLGTQEVHNALNNICSRARQDWFIVSWRERARGAKQNVARDSVLAELDEIQRTLNTTWDSTPGLDLFGNQVLMPAGRRHSTTSTIQPRKRRSKSSACSSTRLRRAPQYSGASRLLGREDEEDTAAEARGYSNGDDNDSDVELNPMAQRSSRPKRKRATTVNFAVEEQSNTSADSGFQPEGGSDQAWT